MKTSERGRAEAYFERARVELEKQYQSQGLLWLVESWRTALRAEDKSWQHAARVSLSAWSRYACSLQGKFQRTWKEADGGPNESPPLALLSRDGNSVLMMSDEGDLAVWDTATGNRIGPQLEQGNSLISNAVSPDGRMVLTQKSDHTARIWNPFTGEFLGAALKHQQFVNDAAITPDGRTVVTATERTARLWDAATGRQIGMPMVHDGHLEKVSFSPSGLAVLTRETDRATHLETIRLWDALTGKAIGTPMPQKQICS